MSSLVIYFSRSGENYFGGELKDIGENQCHDCHGEHRVQQTPKNTQNAALIFYFKIAGNQLLEQKTVFCPNIFHFIKQSICLQCIIRICQSGQ